MPKIVGVIPNDDYTLTINLNNRHQLIGILIFWAEAVRA